MITGDEARTSEVAAAPRYAVPSPTEISQKAIPNQSSAGAR
jgi:hypothetical protein